MTTYASFLDTGSSSFLPMGGSGAINTELTIAKSLLITTPDFEFATEADAVSETKLLEAIRDRKVIVIKNVFKQETKDKEATIEEAETGVSIQKTDTVRKMMYSIVLPLYAHQILKEYSFKDLKLIILDMNNKLMCTSPDGIKIRGFGLGFFKVGAQKWDGWLTELQCNFKDGVTEWDKKGRIIEPEWSIEDVNNLTKLTITPSTVNHTTYIMTAMFEYVDDTLVDDAGAKLRTPWRGAVKEQIQLLKTGETVASTPTSMVETSTPGLYTINGTAGTFTGGTIKVIPVADTMGLYISDPKAVIADNA